MTLHENRWNRREFLKKSVVGAAFAGLAIVPRHVLGGASQTPPSEKVNLACIGVGNRGWQVLQGMQHHNIVALCDVDEEYLAQASERYPNARKYRDFRKLLDWEENNIDAVVVATPDHVHVPATMMALKMGKHCYTEKPLGHNVYEVREVTRVADRYGLATQLGNTGHSSQIYRGVVELIRAGTIGEVKEVHAWCDNEWEDPPRVAAGDGRRGRNRPLETLLLPREPLSGPQRPLAHALLWRDARRIEP